MKHKILHRAGALVLALALALTLTVPAWADDVAVTGVTLDQTTLNLTVGDTTAVLRATVTPADADQTVEWASSDTKVVTVNANGRLNAKAEGTATIYATAGGFTANCRVTVTAAPNPFQFTTGDEVRSYTDSKTWELETTIAGNPPDPVITWTVTRKSDSDKTTLPTLGGNGEETEDGAVEYKGVGASVTIGSRGAGDFIVTATYNGNTISKDVTISGIVLVPSRELNEDGNVQMYLNDSIALSVKPYGLADTRDSVIWMSSDGSVVAVVNGSLTSYGLGTAVISATKGNYSADCKVEVVEDESVIAEGYTATASRPLNIGEAVYARLNEISKAKTEQYEEYADKDNKTGYGLKYINNLKVSTSQGTLYYNYVSEGDTGNGVGTADQFAKTTAGTTYYSIDKLYFVPRAGFTGTAEITFQGVADNNRNFSGTIKVNVGMGSVGEDGQPAPYQYQISYRTRAGEPAWFMASDFNAFCKSETGRSFGSVTFSMPRSSDGVLYYNYMGGTGTPVTTTTRFTQSGVYTLDNVCFVPSAAYDSKKPVTISFQVVDSSGETKSGTVEVEVIPADVDGDPSSVMVLGEKGQPVTLQGELFNDACLDTIKDTLSFVVFKLPDPKEGVLYYNYKSNGSYDSRVTATTRCYYSGVPGLSGVTFVPGSGASGRIAIPYTGYGSTGTSFSGTLYISLDETNSSTIRYSVEKNGMVTFRASDFYNAGLYQKGVGVDYVTFTAPGTDLGTLYYDYRSSTNSGSSVYGSYYVSPSSGQKGLNLVSFKAAGKTGTVTIEYEATCGTGSNRQEFKGQVVIQVGAIAAADANFSCNTGRQVGLSSYSLSSACSPVLGVSMSYIEITGVPAQEEGRLYLNYSGFGTGTAVKPGDRFYRVGSPSIDRLTFVPRAGFTGEAEITYIGYSDDGSKQASGRAVVNVSQSTSSWYFNDMGSYVWAIDSVDYLCWNGTVNGVGGGRYNPSGTIIKGDFTLMLVRAYGLSASGSASFYDVPADSYYADAIRIAALLGVDGGANGYYDPKTDLSRQDAMLMIFNALKASGRVVTNGLAADLSVFYDEGDIAPYAKEAVGCLVQMGVVGGFGNGYLLPRQLLNRAEAAKLLHAIMTL